MSDFVRNVLVEQRKRLVGSLMQYLEQNVYHRLPQAEREALRTKVLSSVGSYHDICLDMLKASVDDGPIQNEEALRAIADLHADVRSLRREVRDG